jgi:undecaprenyl-diphosphatase
VFAWINARSGHAWLRVPQQWGTPWTLPGLAVVAVARGRRPTASAALGCLALIKAVEAATKRWFARPRPALVQPTVRHDDAPIDGGSLPSGHAAVAAAATVLVQDLVPLPFSLMALPVTAVTVWTRVRQGAHEPLDVLAGLLLGTGVALAITEVVDRMA